MDVLQDPCHGIAVKDRRLRLRKYPACFVGNCTARSRAHPCPPRRQLRDVARELVDWLMNHGWAARRDVAVTIGRRLVATAVIYPVSTTAAFADQHLLFRFQVCACLGSA